MKIVSAQSKYIAEKLKAPFGFKGGFLSELWQVVCKISTAEHYGVGVGVQSVLWSDATVFTTNSETDGNTFMYKVTAYALRLLEGREGAT